jgi:lysophospholipase L1-like esterase
MLNPKEAAALETRMLQLIESTAVAVPGLVRASEPLKQNADATFSGLQRAPQNPALTYRLINQVKAYLALADSTPRPNPFPEVADRQFAELRDDLQRLTRQFEASLEGKQLAAEPSETDPDNLRRYADADSKLPPPGKLPRIVFLGDSITEGWRLNEYFTGQDFINRGIAGQTTSQMLGRFLQDVVALRPRAVLIMGGINDIARGYGANTTEQNLQTMADIAKAHGVRLILASILPVSDYHKNMDPQFERTPGHSPAAIVQINRWIQDYCSREKLTYLNFYSSMIDSSGHMQADLSDDGLHPNSRGYRVMSPLALQAIDRTTAQANGEPKRRFRILNGKSDAK